MEEFIGGLWDKLIKHTAYRGHPKARTSLKEMERIAPIFDLSAYVELLDWSIAVDRFVSAGDARLQQIP